MKSQQFRLFKKYPCLFFSLFSLLGGKRKKKIRRGLGDNLFIYFFKKEGDETTFKGGISAKAGANKLLSKYE
jgi:hypothetical protein